MKKYSLLLFFICCWSQTFSQKNKVDSLRNLLAVEKQDSNKVTLLWNMALGCYTYKPDTALILAQKALYLAQKIKFIEGESRASGILANTFLKIGNYPRALEFYLAKLKLEEKGNNPGNLASVIINIGIVYVYQEEYRKALPYYFKADSIIAVNNLQDMKYYSAINLGDVYNRLNINDTAFIYFNKALDLAIKMKNGDMIGASLVGIGHSYDKQENYPLAIQKYHEALYYFWAANDEDLMCEAAIGLSKVYHQINIPDSAIYYAHLTLSTAIKDGFISWQMEAANFLKEHFKKIKNSDSAFVYMEMAQFLQDSISSKERIRKSQILSSNEQLRQAELVETRRKAKSERAQQLQFLFIGIFIPGLFLFTLFLSRRKVHVKVIKAMGIVSLLILFEYLTLLLHPYVLDFTNHTPVFEIMIFVSIAAVLIPSHHRIENWLIETLTRRKNLYPDGHFNIRTIKLKKRKPSN